jgi:oligosaccharide repeat unit polymerase
MTLTSTILVTLLAVILLGPLVGHFLSKDRFDIFRPPVLFSLLMLLCYVFPFYSFVQGTDPFSRGWDSTPPRSGAVEGALAVAILAALSFYIGYYRRLAADGSRSGPAARDPYRRSFANPARLRFIGVTYTLTGLGLFSIGVYLVGGFAVLSSSLGDRLRAFAGLNYFLDGINLLLSVSLVWWGTELKRGRRGDWLFWIYTTAAIAINTLQGNKSTLFIFVLAMAVMYHVLGRPISTAKVSASALILFGALTFYGLVAREYLAVGEFTTIDPQNLNREDLSQVVNREFEGNFLQLQVLTELVDRMPEELPYQHGRTLLSLFTMPVPRWLWPDKPLPAAGVFTMSFWPDKWLEGGTSMPTGLVGELYMNFASLGVAAGMWLFGRVYARAEAQVRLQPRNVRWALCYALLTAMMLHYLRGEFVAPTVTLLILGLPALVAERYVFEHS